MAITSSPVLAASAAISRRSFLGGGLALAGVVALAACGGPSTPSGGAAKTYLALVAEPPSGMTRTFNPFSATARWVARNAMYEPLMISNAITGVIEPWLATGYTWNDDATQLTLELRPGVLWSDGKPFTAGDVVATFDLIRKNPGLVSTAGEARDQLKTVVAKGDHTVVVTFSRPSATALYAVVEQFVVPQHLWSDVSDPTTFANPDPVGTGPFTTVESFTGQVYRVTRNPHYWQQLQVDGLSLRSYSGNDQISAEVLSGNIDWGGLIPDPDKTFVAKDPAHNHYWWPRTRTVNLQLNTTKKIFADADVRRALSMAIDRQRIIDIAYWGKTEPANAASLPVEHFKKWIDAEVVSANQAAVTLDSAGAAALLDRAGCTRSGDGVRTDPDGAPMRYKIIVPTGWTDWIASAQSIVEDLKKIGVELDLSTLAFDAWTAQVFNGEFDVALLGMTASATPYRFYYETMSEHTVQPVGKQSVVNAHRFGDAEATRLLDAFAALTDEGEQVAAMGRIEKRFAELLPVVPLFESPDYGLYIDKRYTGFPNADNAYAPLSLSLDNTGYLVFPKLTKV